MATIYISPTGNDTTGDGTSGNPYQTISKAHTVASNGDTVYCLAGTYTWTSQTFTRNLTITGPALANGYPVAIFDAAAGSVTWTITGNVTFTNLIFQNNVLTTNNGFFESWVPGVASIFNNCVFRSIQFQSSNFSHGFNSINVTCNNCLFDDIYLNGTSDAQRGLFGATNAAYPWLFTLNNCVIYCVNSGVGRLGTIVSSDVSSIKVLAVVKNCIVYNGTGSTIYLYRDYNGVNTGVTCTYSCNYLMSNVPSGAGNITSDPLFVDETTGNFRLRPTSPCLNAGVAV